MTLPDINTLTRLFVTPSSVPSAPGLTQNWVGGIMTAWDAVSFANTVTVGPVVYQNLPVVSPNGLTEGTVLLALGPSGYIVIGMLGTAKGVTLIDPIRYRSLRSDVSSPVSSTALVNAGTINFLLNEGTQYAVDGCLFYNTNSSANIKLAWDGPPNMATKWSNWGTQDTSLTHLLFDAMTTYGDANTQETYGWGHSAVMHPKGWFSTTDTGGLLQLRFGQNTSNATPAVLQAGSWMRIAELGPSAGTTTYIGIYPATGSRSYDGSGVYIGAGDGDNNMYMGGPLTGRSHGNEQHMWIFNGAQMRTDLTGATVLSAQVFLYCWESGSPQADYAWQWHTDSTIQTTMPSGGFGGGDVQNAWTPPGWAGFDVTPQISSITGNNANSILGGPAGFSDAYGAFYGYGFSVSYRPYMQVTYAI